MRIILNGAMGHMGREVMKLIDSGYKNSSLAAAIDKFGDGTHSLLESYGGDADCIVDFSNHACAKSLCEYAQRRGLPLIVATTGHTDEEKSYIYEAAKKVPVFFSGNMSLGIAVLRSLVKQAVTMFPDADIEIVEKHHNRKLDVPSGTALMLAETVKEVRDDSKIVVGRHENGKREKNEIGIHSLRMGNIVGEHEVIISTDTQTLTLKHEAHDRALFAEGALEAAAFIIGKPAGLYTMKDIL